VPSDRDDCDAKRAESRVIDYLAHPMNRTTLLRFFGPVTALTLGSIALASGCTIDNTNVVGDDGGSDSSSPFDATSDQSTIDGAVLADAANDTTDMDGSTMTDAVAMMDASSDSSTMDALAETGDDASDSGVEAGDAEVEAGDAEVEAGDAATEAGDDASDAAMEAGDDSGDAGPQCSQDTDCTSHPTNTCNGNVATTYPAQGTCNTGTCNYPGTMQTCQYGCMGGACNTQAPTFSAMPSAGAATLAKTPNLDPATTTGPANTDVNVAEQTQPASGFQLVTLYWTNDNFSTKTPIVMDLTSQAGGVDTWSALIPGQPANTTVRFYMEGLEWDGSTTIYDPGSNNNWTYKTQ
jgi:hypothetical protein